MIWLRADLRTRDNRALDAACRESEDGVIAVFAICPAQWREHDWAPARVDLLLRCLASLSEDLATRGIPLRVLRADRFDELPARLLALARRHGCRDLYLNREYEWNERLRDRAVTEAFEGDGRRVHAYTDQLVLPPEAIRTGGGDTFRVFTPFARRFRDVLATQGVPTPLRAPRPRRRLALSPSAVPRRIAGFVWQGDRDPWPAGESAARARLRGFVDRRIDAYAEARDVPEQDGTSRLSPYLALGVLSPAQCLAAAARRGDPSVADGGGAAVWTNELLWREFYRHILIAHPRVSRGRPFQRWTEAVAWRDDEQALARWKAGATGVPIVDAAMRELARTGWMHNRLRMISASFLCKHLLIDWREGERHFMRQLVDGDLASNNGGWQWCASTGTDACPDFRVFQPVRQSERFDPGGRYIRRVLPELAGLDDRAIHLPAERSPLEARAAGYPAPIVDLAEGRERAIEAFRRARGAWKAAAR